ncbi:glutamyl-tRNA(Gln) amidotransferase subunit B, mitochondrial-like [Penaeus indicus]|uniref:glutamyl-tRNA(Gln) amidotransferase subunit B, mitochondrial-like n=1 Tax=Penaeus indicus TaxID=29960 RepID=UPI00300D3447
MRLHWRVHKTLGNFLRHYGTAQIRPGLIRDIWQPVIGLEIHAQISSTSKLFSRVGTRFGAPPNSQVGVFESAHPGTLPVLNKRCVEAAIKTALALQATVNKTSWFVRKHYFYPDLPAGYQITQLDHPIASDGHLDFIVYNAAVHRKPYRHSVKLIQIQLEEDSGKSIHDKENHRVLVDLNRAGQPLMELVFAPDLRDGEEAAALVKELSLILLQLGTCNCRMEEGSLRVDANISVHRPGEPLGTRTEVKNLNSIRSLVRAIDFEIERQIGILESGGVITNETRSFDADRRETITMRDKEVVQDYRFMHEPNLPPLRLFDSSEGSGRQNGSLDINAVRQELPELPEEKRQQLMKNYGVTLENAIILVNNPIILDFFLDVMADKKRDSRLVCNLLLTNLLGTLNSANVDFQKSPMSAGAFGEIVDLQQSGQILNDTSLRLIDLICNDGDLRSPTQIVNANNWLKFSDDDLLESLVVKVLNDNQNLVKKYRAGKKKMFNALMGKVRAATDSRADMKKVKEIITKKLTE